jgi:hypothetical protein
MPTKYAKIAYWGLLLSGILIVSVSKLLESLPGFVGIALVFYYFGALYWCAGFILPHNETVLHLHHIKSYAVRTRGFTFLFFCFMILVPVGWYLLAGC